LELKIKIWIENDDENLVFGDEKNEVMKYIESTGSLKETSIFPFILSLIIL
jgi:molybdenum-dependent DNA-binding transcriptional regulator ModE